MEGLLAGIGILIILLLLVLAGAAIWLWWMGYLPALSERGRHSQQALEAERRIADIGHRAQQAIMAEALARLRARSGDHL